MFREERHHSIDILFVISLFAVFALSVVMLTGTGARVYERIVNNMEINHNERTTFSYLVNKIRQSDEEGKISVGKFAGIDSLIITEEIDNVNFCTYLYYYDGNLKELFIRQAQDMDPKYGTDILALDSFYVEQKSDSLYELFFKAKGNDTEKLFVHVRSDAQ